MEKLVDDTLKEAKHSLQGAAKVNIGVLVTGLIIVLGSFIYASITSQWQATAFGGVGMAGIITSLITNPSQSISASVERLVQVQIVYFTFLSQLSILSRASEGITILERSKQLGEQMVLTLKSLKENL